MADTERSLATLLALLADNTTGQISPQDIRDTLVSLTPAGASICINIPALTNIALVNTPIFMAGTYILTNPPKNFDSPVNGRIRYLGANTRFFQVVLSVSMTAVGNNKDIAILIAKNGAAIPTTSMSRRHTTAQDIGTISTTITLELATNDFLEIFVENQTDATDVTGVTAILSAYGGLE